MTKHHMLHLMHLLQCTLNGNQKIDRQIVPLTVAKHFDVTTC